MAEFKHHPECKKRYRDCGVNGAYIGCLDFNDGYQAGRRLGAEEATARIVAFFMARADAQQKRGGGVSSVLSWLGAAELIERGEHLSAEAVE